MKKKLIAKFSKEEAEKLKESVEALISYKNSMKLMLSENETVEDEEAINEYIKNKIIEPIVSCLERVKSQSGDEKDNTIDAQVLIEFLYNEKYDISKLNQLLNTLMLKIEKSKDSKKELSKQEQIERKLETIIEHYLNTGKL